MNVCAETSGAPISARKGIPSSTQCRIVASCSARSQLLLERVSGNFQGSVPFTLDAHDVSACCLQFAFRLATGICLPFLSQIPDTYLNFLSNCRQLAAPALRSSPKLTPLSAGCCAPPVNTKKTLRTKTGRPASSLRLKQGSEAGRFRF